MYKSPIEKIYGELQTQMVQEDENMVMKAIRKVEVDVDKEDLIKALQYDRNQYTKGYEDGKNEVLDKIRIEIKHFMYNVNPSSSESDYACNYILDILDKYKIEREEK